LNADALIWKQIDGSTDPVTILPDGLRAMIDGVLNPEVDG
jgi:hypothetical protein